MAMVLLDTYWASLMKFSRPWNTPLPVALVRPWIPPWLIGFPVKITICILKVQKLCQNDFCTFFIHKHDMIFGH